jgi:uncharacterized protein (UPF0179 family)
MLDAAPPVTPYAHDPGGDQYATHAEECERRRVPAGIRRLALGRHARVAVVREQIAAVSCEVRQRDVCCPDVDRYDGLD